MKHLLASAVAASIAALGHGTAQASCGAAFCFVNTNWSLQGIWTQPGPHFDLRYEYIDPMVQGTTGFTLTGHGRPCSIGQTT